MAALAGANRPRLLTVRVCSLSVFPWPSALGSMCVRQCRAEWLRERTEAKEFSNVHSVRDHAVMSACPFVQHPAFRPSFLVLCML